MLSPVRNLNVPKCPQGLVVVICGDKDGFVGFEEISGIVKSGGGNLYSGQFVIGDSNLYSGQFVIGGRGKFRPPELPDNVGAKSFLLAWTLPMLENETAMKRAKRTKRIEAICV
ncbi:hypothetical protein L6164_036382 [Bauhinia variegata]|uniref:Uncharacterized protein n=1 Tax=Bauhinia variegata TaxID=167791 RepID=A0ACB9KGV9_BAUVA|nr:hypothetical protein L6164_036382 [Bauhinia variegata]